MLSFTGVRAQEIYPQQLKTLLEVGDRVEVRGRTTLELLNCTTEIHRPWDPCILIPGRRWNPWLALSEGLWILAGRNDVKSLLPYNSTITEFSDNGKTLYGAYGKRMYWQIEEIVHRLRVDPSDRRAVLQIWDSLSSLHETAIGMGDLTVNSKDPPCNNLVYFKLRDGKLHMTVINRSNDIHWGLYAVNAPTFAMLQQYIAARLGADMGIQTHFSNSLHVYVDDSRARTVTQHMNAEPEYQEYPAHLPIFEHLEELSHFDFAKMCGMVLDDEELPGNTPPFLGFAQDYLRMYRERTWQPEILTNAYADWIQAGWNFVDRSTRFNG